MANRRKSEVIIPAGAHVIIPDKLDPERFDEPGTVETYAETAIAGLLAEIGSRDDGAKVTVKKIENQGGVRKELWLYECEPSEFSVADVQEHYGAGEYRVIIYGKQPDSNYKGILANKKLSIAAPKSGAQPKALGGALPVLAPQPVHSPAQFDMQALAAMIAQLVPKAPSRAEVLAELKEMREIFGGGGASVAASDPLDALSRAVALLKTTQGNAPILNEDGEIAPTALISQGIALVREMLDTGRANAAARASGALPSPDAAAKTNGAISPAPQPSQAQTQAEDEMRIFQRAQLAMLLNAARQGMATETYAGLIYEQASDEMLTKLQSESWWSELLKLEPGFSDQKPWCEKLRAEVIAIITEETQPDPDQGNPDPGAALTGEGDPGITPGDGQ